MFLSVPFFFLSISCSSMKTCEESGNEKDASTSMNESESSIITFKSPVRVSYEQLEVNGVMIAIFDSALLLKPGKQEVKAMIRYNDKMCRRDPQGKIPGCLSGYSCKVSFETKANEKYELDVTSGGMYVFSEKNISEPLAVAECENR